MAHAFAILLALLRGLGALLEMARERQWLKAGEQQALADLLRKQADDLQKAENAREAARRDHARVPRDRGLPDDGFRRD